ncbi:UDP-glucose 4-epimerase [Geomonas sp. Red276]
MGAPRVLITGAGGFLGSHIARHFGGLGYSVAAVGRFATDYTRTIPNLWRLCGMTLPDPALVKVIKSFRPDLLVHCAGTASVADSVQNPYGDFLKTVDVCAFTLDTLRLHAPDCRFVLLSSASVYGNPETLPILESAPLRPVSPYGYHKMLCETLAQEHAALHGMKVAILRIFSAYGERLQRQVVHDICQKFANPRLRCVELFGTGAESRDFIHALDVARAVETIHNSDASGVFNAAAGVQTTIAELAETLARHFDNGKQVTFNGVVRHGDPLNWEASIDKLAALGYRPSVDLDAGLAGYISWFKEQRKSRHDRKTTVAGGDTGHRVQELDGRGFLHRVAGKGA